MRSRVQISFLPFLPRRVVRGRRRVSLSISSRDRAQTCRPPWRNSARPWSRGEYDRRRARAREDEGAQEGSRWRPEHEAALRGVQSSEGDWVVYAKETRRLRCSTARSSTTRCPPCGPESGANARGGQALNTPSLELPPLRLGKLACRDGVGTNYPRSSVLVK